MINLRFIEIIISFITVAIAYVLSTTLAGYFQAWSVKKLGDDSEVIEEFLTLNPLVHIDPVGAFCLFFLGIGWGTVIPINPAAIKGSFRLLLAFFSKPVAYLGIAFCSLLALLRVFGLKVLTIAMMMVLSETISLSAFSKIYQEKSSFILAIALIFVMLIYIGVLFAVLNLIIGGFQFASYTFLQPLARSEHGDLIMFVVPFILLILLARPLKVLVVYGISYSAYFFAPLLGVS
jgi:hypothetical protein